MTNTTLNHKTRPQPCNRSWKRELWHNVYCT